MTSLKSVLSVVAVNRNLERIPLKGTARRLSIVNIVAENPDVVNSIQKGNLFWLFTSH